MAGTFEVYADKTGRYRFRLRDDAGEIVATSPLRPTSGTADEARAACQAVQDAAAGAAVTEV